MTDKIDLKKKYKALFAPKKTPQIVEVPPLPYLMIDGVGAPESPPFAEAIAALYPAAYTLKFHCKTTGKGDFRRGASRSAVVGRRLGRVHDQPTRGLALDRHDHAAGFRVAG